MGGATSRRPSVSGSAKSSQTTATRAPNVKEVKFYNVATPPITTPECLGIEGADGDGEWFSACMVKAVEIQWLSRDDDDIDQTNTQCSDDALHQWHW